MRALGALICTAALATQATADSDADADFRRGRELIVAGQLEQACEAFARSQRAQPRVATLLNLADCWEQRGMFANARETFVQARILAHERGDTRREAEAERRIAALEPRIAPPPAPITVQPPTPSAPLSLPTPPDMRTVVVVPVESARRFAIGAVVGMNVQRESLLFGARVIGAVAAPGGAIRVIGGFQFSRYNDEPSLPDYITRTYSFSGSVDYLWMPRPALALGGGLGFGADYDSVSPVIRSPEPDMERVSDLGSFFAVRATPISLRLRGGAVEVGLHLAMLLAADELTFSALFAADWFVW
ncbi:MAG: tetratricopeptide repeat protein [Kofleriaceae bacterium]